MAADSLEIRAATAADDPAVRALFAATFPDSPKLDREIVRWQYWENPFGTVRSWVAVDGDQIVAHYAGMPVPGWLDGAATTLAVGIDAATAPTHRGRGLFERLARAVYADCGHHQMPVTVCFPNQNSLRGFVKAGGTPLGRLDTFVLPLRASWVAGRFGIPTVVTSAALAAAFRRPHSSGAHQVDAPPDGLDPLWAMRPAPAENGICRDHAWWEWRYARRPGDAYRYFEIRTGGRLEAAAATTEREAFGGRFTFVMELLAVSPTAARAAIGAAAAAAEGTDGLAAIAVAGSAVAGSVRAAGLRRLPHRLEPKPLNMGIVDNAGGLAAPASGRRWSVSWGDLDHL